MNKKGGRGKCRYCGKTFNNVSYHSAKKCEKNPFNKIKAEKVESVLVEFDRLLVDDFEEMVEILEEDNSK